jgi:glycosyltransferase involved in cell wall biosynthesis|nr:hypothetical protein [uncultured Flavobacterium sp.]
MKKFLFVLFFIVFKSVSYGQKLNGYVVTNANDTIDCDFFETNLFNDKIFDAISVYNKVKVVTKKGEEIKYYPKDIKCFYIEGTTDGNLKFVSFKYDNYNHFYHEVVGDRLSYFRLYNKNNPYSNGLNQTYKEFIFKDDIFLELGIFNTRKNLALLIEDNKEIYDKWMDKNGYYKLKDAFNIINQYNNFYKK